MDDAAGPTRFPFSSRTAILALEHHYWELSAPAERDVEADIERAMPSARRAGGLSKDLFITIARWKSRRNTRLYQRNTEADVWTATRAAFVAPKEDGAIEALTDLHGVALRTATALLHWMRPERFPILDFRVVAALDVVEPSSWEDVTFYSRTAGRIRALAAKHKLDLRVIDRALWAWQKEASGPTRRCGRAAR